jgi:hypothetical protein
MKTEAPRSEYVIYLLHCKYEQDGYVSRMEQYS